MVVIYHTDFKSNVCMMRKVINEPKLRLMLGDYFQISDLNLRKIV